MSESGESSDVKPLIKTEKKGKNSIADNYLCSFVSIHYIICECGEKFPSEKDLREHLAKEHPHKKEKKEYKCGICSEIYNTEEECITHYESNHMSAEPESGAESEVEFKQEVYSDDEENVNEGALQALEDVPDDQLLYLMQNKPRPLHDPENRKRKLSKSIVCEVCGKRYTSNAALKYHQRVHTGEKPYQCPMCPKTFSMPLFLQIHVRTHTGERPYACPECPKRFSNKAALMRHERVHSGIKPYACPMCDKYFTQSNSMKLHVTTVHLKQPAPYKSKNRKLKAQQRSIQHKTRSKSPPLSTLDVLRNGLESYVLGPLRTEVENLKSDECGNVSYEVVESEVMNDDESCFIIYE